jgi:hypothetical protein
VESGAEYVARILAEPGPRPLEGPTKLYDERGEDFTPQWGRFDRADY